MGGTQGMKSSTPAPGTFCHPDVPFLLFNTWGAGREPFLAKGRRSKRLPLSPRLDTYGKGPKSSLAEEGCPGCVRITNSRPATSVSGSLAEDELPGSKFCDSPIPGVPLTTRQPAETCKYRVSRYHTHFLHI